MGYQLRVRDQTQDRIKAGLLLVARPGCEAWRVGRSPDFVCTSSLDNKAAIKSSIADTKATPHVQKTNLHQQAMLRSNVYAWIFRPECANHMLDNLRRNQHVRISAYLSSRSGLIIDAGCCLFGVLIVVFRLNRRRGMLTFRRTYRRIPA